MTTPTPVTSGQYRIFAGFAGFLILIGAVLSIFGVFFLRTAFASYGWPSAPGTVQAINASLYRSEYGGNRRTYVYQVTYSYAVNEIAYTGDRYSLGEGPTASRPYDTAREAERAGKEAYPPGSEIPVYYDPQTPTAAVLKRGTNIGTYAPLIMGLFFLPCGVLFLTVLPRLKPPAS
jgi:hypothetical protein